MHFFAVVIIVVAAAGLNYNNYCISILQGYGWQCKM